MSHEPDLFALDPNRLDAEWVEQPRLYHVHAVKLADARETWERAKAGRDVVTAELDRFVRRDPAAFGLEKVTESGVEKAVILQIRHKDATEKVITAKHGMDVMQAMVDALDHRKRALEKLVDLRLAHYFSEPRAKGETAEPMRQVERDSAFGKRKK